MRALVDTNVLLRSAQPAHPLCSQATHSVSKLLRQREAVFSAPGTSRNFVRTAPPFHNRSNQDDARLPGGPRPHGDMAFIHYNKKSFFTI